MNPLLPALVLAVVGILILAFLLDAKNDRIKSLERRLDRLADEEENPRTRIFH